MSVTVTEFLDRDPHQMSWVEYSQYITETTQFTQQQSMIISSLFFDIEDHEVAEEADTTVKTVRTQKSNLDLSNISDLSRVEFWKPPVPNTAFRHVDTLEYFMSDDWPREGNTGTVDIYCAVHENNSYIAVVESWKVTEEAGIIETEGDVWGCVEKRERTTVYQNLSEFERSSPYSDELDMM